MEPLGIKRKLLLIIYNFDPERPYDPEWPSGSSGSYWDGSKWHCRLLMTLNDPPTLNDPHILLTLNGPGKGTFILTPNDPDPPRYAVGTFGVTLNDPGQSETTCCTPNANRFQVIRPFAQPLTLANARIVPLTLTGKPKQLAVSCNPNRPWMTTQFMILNDPEWPSIILTLNDPPKGHWGSF